MNKLRLGSQLKTETLPVPVEFIDTYMPAASGEAVKVYLCLLRASQDPSRELSLEELAELFDLTGKKLLQILSYWEEQGLLCLSRSGGELTGLELLKPGASSGRAGTELLEDGPAPFRTKQEELSCAPELPAENGCGEALPDKPLNIHELDEDDAFTELLSLAEFYLKRPLNSTQREILGNCYLLFGRQSDMTEYLLEYCIEQGHPSFRYLESVARGWHEEGFRNLEEVRNAAAGRNRKLYSIKKAFGISNRSLVKEESALAEQWTRKFDMELVLEACSRTMTAIHTPSFQYTDSILKVWEEKGVRTLSDVESLDRERRAKQAKAGEAAVPARSRNSFQNFEQRQTDYSALIPNFYGG